MNGTELISKKDLLQATGISYGQLYRWRRKGLIPEDWFIRKSTFTGQETFFPRDKALARVARIQALKDEDLSLDEIAGTVGPLLSETSLSEEVLRRDEVLSPVALDLYIETRTGSGDLGWGELLTVYILETLLQSGGAGREECRAAADVLSQSHESCQSRECDLVMVRKLGVATCFLVSSKAQVHFEGAAHQVARLHLPDCLEELANRIQREKETHG